MSEYPEHDKLSTISDRSQVIGEFLDWLGSTQHVHLMRWESATEPAPCPAMMCENGRIISASGRDRGKCSRCEGSGWRTEDRETWRPDGRRPEKLLADYFGIDLARLETEKRAMLDAIRAS